MVAISTVNGPVESDQLGRVLIHEHVRVRDEAMVAQFPHVYDEASELQAAVDAVKAAMAAGVHTIADPAVMGLGRDVSFTRRVVEATGITLVMATGLYTYDHLPLHLVNRDVDYLADLFVHDITVGIQGSEVRAGFLKCATDAPGVNANVEKVLRAVARAHRRTGVPIMTHSHPASGQGLAQMAIFADEGVDPHHVLVGHSGDTDSADYLLRLLQLDCFIGMDRYGLGPPFGIDTEWRNWTVAELCARGFADRMLLSHDSCATIDWFPRETVGQLFPNWTTTYLFEQVIPDLHARGVTQGQIEQMLVDNARRWLEPVAPY